MAFGWCDIGIARFNRCSAVMIIGILEAAKKELFSFAMVEEAVITAVKRYLAALASLGIHARRAVLFGSFACGHGGEHSDIDLIVIAPEFDGSREISLVKTLWRATVSDNRIEPIPCGEQEWETDRRRPILEIARREGVVIGV